MERVSPAVCVYHDFFIWIWMKYNCKCVKKIQIINLQRHLFQFVIGLGEWKMLIKINIIKILSQWVNKTLKLSLWTQNSIFCFYIYLSTFVCRFKISTVTTFPAYDRNGSDNIGRNIDESGFAQL